ncbi:LamG-like jellyroll fold domain-containing protein [Bacillus horti]|uniref:F5/8 type C domain-containing protein n=1 Tax=Caldalkalibacillus horti TaxID=77523 RepID=A0ABT9VYS3_9BACI|nr:LamG-like jellyroll fold domain-containing protein [Bacillus horti]MDQ0166128.1 hypothetical protein [Bacillus horti]
MIKNPYMLRFTGSTSINLGNPAHLSLTRNMTIEMWIKVSNLSARRNPYAKAYGGEGTITIETTGIVNFYWGTSGVNGNPYQGFSMNSPLRAGVWTHLAVVRDVDEGRLFWYRDGELVNQANTLYAQAAPSNLNATIGSGYVSNFQGDMDEFRIWSVARTHEEIKENMYYQLLGTEKGLVGYWNFDEGQGTVAIDSSPFKHNGQITSPSWVKGEIPIKSQTRIHLHENPVIVNRGEPYDYKFDIHDGLGQLTVTRDFQQSGDTFAVSINKNEWSDIHAIRLNQGEYVSETGMLDLRGGNFDRSTVYTAVNGVVVTSSDPTYVNSTYYYLAYLFNRSYGTTASQYWMTTTGNSTRTLTFNLSTVMDEFYLTRLRIFPYSRSDTSSNYRISVSENGVNWTSITGWVMNHHTPSNANYIPPGISREHDINVPFQVRFIRFELTRQGTWGATLNEIELIGGPPVKFLVRDKEGYKAYTNGLWEIVSPSLPPRDFFNDYGLYPVGSLTEGSEGERPIDLLPSEFEIVGRRIFDGETIPIIEMDVSPIPKHRYKVELIQPYETILRDWTDFVDGARASYSIEIRDSLFGQDVEHVIKITVENGLGDTVEKEGTLYLYNSPPVIQIDMNGLELKASISDLENDPYRYRVLLNGEQVLPLGEGSFTDFLEEESIISRLFLSNEVLIGEQNKLEVIAEDSYGRGSVEELLFEAEYMGLMFADIHNNFYSTDLGELLTYLIMEPMLAGTTSLIYPVKLINKYPFEITNVGVWQDELELRGVIIQLCDEEVPFIASDSLEYGDKVLNYDDEIVFYVRVATRASTTQGGIFEVWAKADPV